MAENENTPPDGERNMRVEVVTLIYEIQILFETVVMALERLKVLPEAKSIAEQLGIIQKLASQAGGAGDLGQRDPTGLPAASGELRRAIPRDLAAFAAKSTDLRLRRTGSRPRYAPLHLSIMHVLEARVRGRETS